MKLPSCSNPKTCQAITTHWGNWDTLLVRIGHHLWKWHKQDRTNKAFTAALGDVWTAKREFRRPIQANREKNRVRAGQTLRQIHTRKALVFVD
jgi:hypothetical protein